MTAEQLRQLEADWARAAAIMDLAETDPRTLFGQPEQPEPEVSE